METFKLVYTLFGGLGLFFFGMKTMSESLQATAGDVIKKVISSLTSNRFLAVLVGALVTVVIQSSSITTVMVVGFVNAGLMNLAQAIGVILGANIGTTVTAWIISIKIGKYGLIFIALGIFPIIFSNSQRLKQIGQLLFALGLVFIGLDTMSDSFRPLRENPSFLNLLAYFSGDNYLSYLASVLMGCTLTMLIQSSSAMMGITIALATTGLIDLHTAIALVLGENIGTTITAWLASVGGTINAKRAARAHAFFNLCGVFIIYLIFPFYVHFIEYLVPHDSAYISPEGDRPYIAFHIAMAHTIFNICATLLFLPFLGYLVQLVLKVVPDPEDKEIPHLKILGEVNEVFPAASILQAHQELKKMADILKRMYRVSRDVMEEKGFDQNKFLKVKKYEQITDNIQKEVTVFICQVMEKQMTPVQSAQCQSIVRVADELESVADYLERMVTYKSRFEESIPVDGETGEEFNKFSNEIWTYFCECIEGIENGKRNEPRKFEKKASDLGHWANQMRDKHLERVSLKKYNHFTALTYSDIVVALRKIRNHSLNVAQEVNRLNSFEV